MLTQAIIQTSTPVTFNVESVDPEEILIVKSISGLSKAGADLFTGDFARGGGYYQGRRAKKRNPVFNFKVNPNYALNISASDIREFLYEIFMEPTATSQAVQVLIKDDKLPDRYFIGYCEDIDADMWSREMGATVSLLCTDPYLRSAEETLGISLSGWYNLPINYEGTAQTGVELTLTAVTDTPRIVVKNNDVKIQLDWPFEAGDSISLNTNEGSLAVRVNNVDRMGAMSADSRWLRLSKQGNVLSTYGSVSGDGRAAITGYKYRAAWWGI